jgi:hypothetical protein
MSCVSNHALYYAGFVVTLCVLIIAIAWVIVVAIKEN